eukprot:TRINITY_DN103558_c0_g1_i1.p1 TRINITY_DN103558_c0_g1~~TRINITY_DN103558_c0_g1_i1.p1  ORF type:complete len:347 (-),score=57.14 TRINITY_DN103558_c0_g1_i1:15-1022(-)
MESTSKRARTELSNACSIGQPGEPWNAGEKEQWQLFVTKAGPRRSYETDVLKRLELASESFKISEYGELKYTINGVDYAYSLCMAQSKAWDENKPSALITGGVHGYETSGVKGALLFLETAAQKYLDSYNIVVAPCVSPWGYEFIQRWNAATEDPNRSFNAERLSQESKALIDMVSNIGLKKWKVHMDLHETTDTDETEFRPALAAKDGKTFEPEAIPDGFYLLGDSGHPDQSAQIQFNKAIIAAVGEVTHIAPADKDGQILGKPVVDADKGEGGIIMSDKWVVGTCCNGTIFGSRADFATTTEVYPDSPKTTDEECNRAQVAAVCAALDYALKH